MLDPILSNLTYRSSRSMWTNVTGCTPKNLRWNQKLMRCTRIFSPQKVHFCIPCLFWEVGWGLLEHQSCTTKSSLQLWVLVIDRLVDLDNRICLTEKNDFGQMLKINQISVYIYIYVYILIFSKDLMLVFLKKTTSGFESVPPADGVRGTWWISDCGKVRWLASEFCLIVACSQVIVFDKHMKIYKKIFDILVGTLIVWIQRLRECGGKPFVSFALPRSFCAVSGPPCRWLWANG